MKRLITSALLSLAVIAPAHAALKIGDKAPDFTAQAAVGGKEFTFNLADALKKGPVVLYFYPKAFTKGCTAEAHEFAEAAGKFKAMGATLIGMSADDIQTLDKFSTSECHSAFPVAADPSLSVIKSYDVALTGEILRAMPMIGKISDRTSFVIAPDGKIVYAYTAMSPEKHVQNTLNAVQQFEQTHKS